MKISEPVNDRIITEIKQRRNMGLKKYGVLLKDAPLSRKDLLQHAKEEALDLAEYLQTLIDMEEPIWPETDERMDNIGPNGNDGDHYDKLI
tara:strand:+ start:538 stop:810 length:273 start_codon:yes stop_codon:yes gene_type:complete